MLEEGEEVITHRPSFYLLKEGSRVETPYVLLSLAHKTVAANVSIWIVDSDIGRLMRAEPWGLALPAAEGRTQS